MLLASKKEGSLIRPWLALFGGEGVHLGWGIDDVSTRGRRRDARESTA